MLNYIVLIILGIIGLWLSAEILIKSSLTISKTLKISATFIGLTILSIGTSIPEIATHIVSSLKILEGVDVSGLAVGTNVGSNIFQITMILGIVALSMTLRAKKKFLKKDYLVMLATIAILFLFSLDGNISRAEGLMLAGGYLFYLWTLGSAEEIDVKLRDRKKGNNLAKYIAAIPIALFFLLFSASVVVNNAETLANLLRVSDSLIGVLIIGFGTALPELATALVALKRKAAGMSLGVLVGSNITNPLFALGIGALISGYSIGWRLLWFDIPFWFFISLLAFVFFWKKKKITKYEAAVLIVSYLVYAALRIAVIR